MNIDVINYRRERAKETLEEAKIMFDNDKFFAVVNRIYYSIFYEAMAILLTKGLSSSKHSGVRSLFNREFVKTGIVNKEFGTFYTIMFGFRQRGDYEEFVQFNKEEVKQWLGKAVEFINAIDTIVARLIE